MKIILACELDPVTTHELLDIPGVIKVEPKKEKVLKKLPADILIAKIEFDIDREILEKVKYVVKATVGLDNVDMATAKDLGVKVKNVPSASVTSVAELTIGLMISLLRKIPQKDADIREGGWNRDLGTELAGKSIGLLGFGRIPKEVTRKLKGFDVKILAYDPYLSDNVFKQAGVKRVELNELLSQSDILSIHVPLVEKTKHMIDKSAFEKMKDDAFLINTARGGVVDTKALMDALKKKLAGAALDVHEFEPLDNHPITKMDNVILTPHIGAYTTEAQRRVGKEVVRIVREILSEQTG